MNLKNLIPIGLCCFLIITSANVTALLPKSINEDIWPDGIFEGTIELGNSQGSITGKLNFGRTSTKGVFEAFINLNNKTYEAKGWFRDTILYGLIKNEVIMIPIIGNLNLQQYEFTANLILPAGFIEATYIASYLPPVYGSYGIGVAEFHIIDESRNEVLTEDPHDVREFMLKVWYPTDQQVNENSYVYMSDVMFSWLMGRAPIPLPFISETAYEDVKPHGKLNAPIASDSTHFPVVLFAHGLDGTIEIYSSYIEELVTRGYVVLSMNHPYIAGVVEFPDGHAIYLQDSSWQTEPEYFEKALRTIIDDAKYTLDYAEYLNSSHILFKGRLDLDRIGMYGHSFGGASTSICCAEDPRIDCGLTLDGVSYEDMLPEGVTKPFFMMTADGRLNSSGIEYIWEKQTTDVYKMSIDGSTHYGYTDVGLLLSHMLPLIPQQLLDFGTIDAKVMTEIVRLFIVGFFDIYLKGEPIQVLINLSEEFESYIQFEYK